MVERGPKAKAASAIKVQTWEKMTGGGSKPPISTTSGCKPVNRYGSEADIAEITRDRSKPLSKGTAEKLWFQHVSVGKR